MDRRRAELASGTSNGLAVSAEAVAPFGTPSMQDVQGFLKGGWPPVAATLTKLSLRGVPFMRFPELSSAFVGVLPTSVHLKHLDLSGTELSTKSFASVCRLASTTLETLNVAENPFQSIPTCISRLKKLRHLNVSGSKLEFIPSSIRDLLAPKSGWLELEAFPCGQLTMLPSKVQAKGPKAIREFLLKPGLFIPRSRLTVVVIGHSESGKTTLVDALDRLQADKLRAVRKTLGSAIQRSSSQPDPAPPGSVSALPRSASAAVTGTPPRSSSTGGSGITLPPQPPLAPAAPQLQSTVGVHQTSWDLITAELDTMISAKADVLPTTVLDFAGQLEYLTTHKFFLPLLDTIYLLVTDVSKSYDEQAKRVAHWVSLLNARVAPFQHDPDLLLGFNRPTFAVVLVGTKRDLAPGTEQQLKANLANVAKIITSTSIAPALVNTHLVSSVTKSGLSGLLTEVVRQSHVLHKLGTELPPQSRVVGRALERLRESGRHVVSDEAVLTEMSDLIDEKETSVSHYMFSTSLEHFAGRGRIIRHYGSSSVWTDPVLIAKIMALFICPLSHQLSFLSTLSAPLHGGAVVTVTDACTRIKTIPAFKQLDPRLCRQLLVALQELDICFEIDKDAWRYFGTSDAFFFPSLRPRGQLRIYHPSLPPTIAHDTPSSEDSPPPSPVIQRLSPSFYIGREFTFTTPRHAVETFFYLQVHMRAMLDYRYKIYADSFFLRATDQSRALLSLDEHERCIYAVCCGGRTPELFRLVETAVNRLASLAHQQVTTHVLCPCCIQGIGLFPSLNSMNVCERGHKFAADRVEEPVPADEEFAYLNELWAPRHHTLPSVGTWTKQGALHFTTLAGDATKKAREEEFLRAKDLFYRFTGRDPLSLYELDKVVFLVNDKLERSFAREYMEMIEKYSRISVPDSPKLSGSEEDMPLREWVMSHFRNYCLRIPSNDNVNLIAGWHGTTEDICFKIAHDNFIAPENIPSKAQHDPGYYGKGIYFTQFPSYSAKYNTGATKCLLLSWLLMGRVYPVTENPNSKINLVGKPRVHGFDSHYVVVKRMNDLVYFPCKIGEKAEYDELVVFRQSQILPRYLFYYRVAQANPALDNVLLSSDSRDSSSSSSEREVVAARTILWVDDKAHGEHTLLMQLWRKEYPAITFKALSSSEELQVWLLNRAGRLTSIGGEHAFRVITNRYRERDGGASAADRLIGWLRNEGPFRKARVLIFCSNPTGLEHLIDQYTTCTADGSVCKKFAVWAEP